MRNFIEERVKGMETVENICENAKAMIYMGL